MQYPIIFGILLDLAERCLIFLGHTVIEKFEQGKTPKGCTKNKTYASNLMI